MHICAALITPLALAGCAGSGSDSSSKPDASVLLATYTGIGGGRETRDDQ